VSGSQWVVMAWFVSSLCHSIDSQIVVSAQLVGGQETVVLGVLSGRSIYGQCMSGEKGHLRGMSARASSLSQ
jgi:hypothetical protein